MGCRAVAARLLQLILCVIAFVPQPVVAAYQPQAVATIPPALQDWRDWVRYPQPSHACPFKAEQFKARHCLWPAYLDLHALPDQARFTLVSHSFAPGLLLLPGGDGYWPSDVSVNEQPGEIVAINGRPALYLPAGEYQVAGRIRWQRIPDAIRIAEDTGLVSLRVNKQRIDLPRRDANGLLWLQEKKLTDERNLEDKLTVSVFRHLMDAVPFQVATEVRLEVSGKPREELLGVVVLDEFELLALDSPLPARVEDNGRLRIQLRPGSWTLSVYTRQGTGRSAMVEQLGLPEVDTIWPSEELWSFEPNTALRLVRIEGAEAVDPNQTRIPDKWKAWKAYRMLPGQVLNLVTLRRGDPEPAPNRMQIKRSAWLGFHGQGIIFQDNLHGQLSRQWRLNMVPPYQLGNVIANGKPQVVTEWNGLRGVELRQSQANLVAVSSFDQPLSRKVQIPASGWQQDFERLSLDLHLPPGWRLLAAGHADTVRNAWLNQWQVWDVFLLLITTAALVKLRGVVVGLVSGVAFVLIYPEEPTILWLWLNLIGVFTLLNLLPSGSLHRLLVFYGRLSALILVMVCLPFLVAQARMALYPQLEVSGGVAANNQVRAPVPVAQFSDLAMETAAEPYERSEVRQEKARRYLGSVSDSLSAAPSRLVSIDPNAAAQTGPGVPDWYWRRASVSWSGPVTADQTLVLYLLKPWDSRLLSLLRVLLLMVIAWGLFRGWRTSSLGVGSTNAKAMMAWLALSAGLIGGLPAPPVYAAAAPENAPPPQAMQQADQQIRQQPKVSEPTKESTAGFPSTALLEELQQRLFNANNCTPFCVAANQARLKIDAQQMTLAMEIMALEAVQVPLPGAQAQWLINAVDIDGQAAPLRREKETLWIALKPGRQRVTINGSVSGAQSIQLVFPMPVHNLLVLAPDWQVRGLDNGRIVGGALTLEPNQALQPMAQDEQQLPPNRIAPFVRVERTLNLGLNWYVETQVERLAPRQGAIKLPVPLLAGESVTTQNVSVANGMVRVVLAADQQRFRWYSSLDKSAEIQLTASENSPWVETWRLQSAPLWHVDHQGIAPIKPPGRQSDWQPSWLPLPGEQVTLRVSKPKAASGKTTTIDQAELTIDPGRQDSNFNLNLTMRSSKGAEQRIKLHEKARVLSVTVDGEVQPSQEQGTHLVIPVNPGQHQVNIQWREPVPGGWQQTGPELLIESDMSNIRQTVNVPRSQWVLLVGGPQLGPAVLIWGELLVVILIAVGLARIPGLPLKTYEWILLAVGLCVGWLETGIIVVLWFVALKQRRQLGERLSPLLFNLLQIGLVLLTLAALVVMLGVIPLGLMSSPDMGIVGNGSSHYVLRWYQDQASQQLPDIWWVALPLWCYRVLMLLWSLWLAVAILRWLKWAWQCFSEAGLWKKRSEHESASSTK